MMPREQAIMDRWDAGQNCGRIATALDLKTDYVRQIVKNFAFAQLAGEMSAAEQRIRAADRRYVAALAASGGSFR